MVSPYSCHCSKNHLLYKVVVSAIIIRKNIEIYNLIRMCHCYAQIYLHIRTEMPPSNIHLNPSPISIESGRQRPTCCSFSKSIGKMPDGNSVLIPDGRMEHLKQTANNRVMACVLEVLLLILVPPIPTICIPLFLIEFSSKLNVASWVHCDFASRQHKAKFCFPILLYGCPV